MLIQLLWFSALFLVTAGIFFLASFGFIVPVAYYEKTETVLATSGT